MGIVKYLRKYYHRTDEIRQDIPEFSEWEFVNKVAEAIENEIPFAAGKIGGSELWAMQAVEFGHQERAACKQLCMWSGFFPENVNRLRDFVEIMSHSLSEVDVLFKWQKYYEAYIINTYCNKLQGIINRNYLAAWSSENPWTRVLEGKKVLVVHPFEDSIISQYKKRDLLFSNSDVLPEFELLTVKAVQSVGGECEEYSDWFAALDGMKERIKRLEFDVAIVGCGAYGLPLTIEIKKMGKVAIHLGGDVQMLFGIMGKRWEQNETARKLYNEYWVHPSAAERPQTADQVENATYW